MFSLDDEDNLVLFVLGHITGCVMNDELLIDDCKGL